MNGARRQFETIDEYIGAFPQDVQNILEKMRETIRKAAPEAEEAISYRIPTFRLNGNLVYFAAFKNHIGFYPTSTGIAAFKRELSPYKGAKGSVQFPLEKPIPYDLVRKITLFRRRENLERAMAAKTSRRALPMNPSELIDKYIADLTDWRGKTLANLRKVIHDADPEIIEEWKWMGTPCWYHDGLISVANAHKDKVKLTFFQGASLPDPDKLFNAGLEGNKWRAIDLYEGDRINERALKDILRAAMAHNIARLKGKNPADVRGIRAKARKK